jgi:hypothetical protein
MSCHPYLFRVGGWNSLLLAMRMVFVLPYHSSTQLFEVHKEWKSHWDRLFICVHYALCACNSVKFPGSIQVFNSDCACVWKRQGNSVSIVTSGHLKIVVWVSAETDIFLFCMERLSSRSILPRKLQPGLEADFPPPSRAECICGPICAHFCTDMVWTLIKILTELRHIAYVFSKIEEL